MSIERNGKKYNEIAAASINNSGVECKIYFCILDGNSVEKQALEMHRTIILDLLVKLIVRFGGFPIISELAKDIYYLFDNSLAVTASIGRDKAGIIYLTINNSEFATPDAIRNVLVHELYHLINEYHYKQNEIYVLIEQWNQKLKKHSEANERELLGNTDILVNFIQANSDIYLEGQAYSKVKRFYKTAAQVFWNYVMDTSLGIVAIELDDKQYIDHMAESDRRRINDFDSQTDILNRCRKIIDYKKPIEKQFYLSMLEILQFMTCYINMPVFSIAWGVLSQSRKWESKHPYFKLRNDMAPSELIDVFKASVKSKCSREVSAYFLDFYEAYLDIVNAGAVHNNPLNPNIEKQIFDTECLKRASKAFKLLNRYFSRLLVEMRKHQVK